MMSSTWANGSATKWLAEPNPHLRDEQKDVKARVAGYRQGPSEVDETRRIIQGGEDANCAPKELAIEHRPQPQPQGSVVPWEKFLPFQSLKVLLVENDDSTRHVVSAMLRNCSYEVIAVSNRLEAWKILEDLTNHIDLILMEAIIPYLYWSPTQDYEPQNLQDIPVIMMSSNDSMGIVFECLTKGAVDFLVKPIRKNELKNLWQHVWRRRQSSSGSGSESGIRSKRSAESKTVEGSDNNTDSYDKDDYASTCLNSRDGSDNGSGTQSSWTKRPVESDSPPDSTCARVLHSTPEPFSNNGVPKAATRVYHGEDDEHGNVPMGKDLEIGVPRNPHLQIENQGKKASATIEGTKKENFAEESKEDGEKLEKEKWQLNSGTPNRELRKEAADLIGTMTNVSHPHMESVATEVPNDITKTNIKDKAIYDTKEILSLELSLKTLRNDRKSGISNQERNVLRHSDLSAFSRYNTASTAHLAPTGNVGSCSPLDNSSEAVTTESMHNLQSHSNGKPNKYHSNGSNNSNDMGSTTNNGFNTLEASGNKPIPRSAINPDGFSPFQPVQNSHLSSHQSVIPGKANASQVQVQHHHHHYHHYHHHVHDMQQQQKQQPNHDDLSFRKHFGPSNLTIEGNPANYSSLNGSNGQNGSSTAVLPEGDNMPSDDGLAGKCGGDAGASGSRSGVDENRNAQREAALSKFRQKRKDRCFDKKVRYQSRKRLAEQRPRVRGQFVRQVCENKSDNKDC